MYYDFLFFLDEPLASLPLLQRENDLIETLFKKCTKQSCVLESGLNYLATFDQLIPSNVILVLKNSVINVNAYPTFIQNVVNLDESDNLPSLSKLLLSACELSPLTS